MSENALGKADSDSDANDKELLCEYCGDSVSHPSHLTRHKRLKHPDKLEDSCPTCGEVFASERGVKLHHKRTHGETLTLASSECKQCGGEFEHQDNRSPHTCSIECRDKWQTGENAANWKGGKETVTCEWCGDEYTLNPNKADSRRFCDKWCAGKWRSEQQTGKDNPWWNGGKVRYYGPNWKRQRRKARKRDQYRCQECGKTERGLGEIPSMHHRVKIRHFKEKYDAPEWYEKGNRLENLIMLCEEHHRKWERLPVQPSPE